MKTMEFIAISQLFIRPQFPLGFCSNHHLRQIHSKAFQIIHPKSQVKMQFFLPFVLLALASTALADNSYYITTYTGSDCPSGSGGANNIGSEATCQDLSGIKSVRGSATGLSITAWTGSGCTGSQYVVDSNDCIDAPPTGSFGSFSVS